MSLLPRTKPLTNCPDCGAALAPGQTACPNGPHQQPGRAGDHPSLRKIPEQDTPPKPGESWPPWLLAGLSEAQRQMLEPAATQPPPSKKRPPGVPEEMARSLIDQGIVVDQDAHGVRLSGTPVRGRGKNTGHLSATDIVRLAADLDGGVLSADQRQNCPKCDAVASRDAIRCTWCGTALTSSTP